MWPKSHQVTDGGLTDVGIAMEPVKSHGAKTLSDKWPCSYTQRDLVGSDLLGARHCMRPAFPQLCKAISTYHTHMLDARVTAKQCSSPPASSSPSRLLFCHILANVWSCWAAVAYAS